MRFANTPRFQHLLQLALGIYAHDGKLSDQKLVKDLGLKCSKSTLNRFRLANLARDQSGLSAAQYDKAIDRVSGVFLNGSDAEKIWNFLERASYIEKTLNINSLSKKSFYSIDDLANGFHCFFEIQRSSIERFEQAGIGGDFFCYKPSFRRKGFVVKSLIKIEPVPGNFFRVFEKQRTSGVFEMDRQAILEESEGFGFVKSNRVWMFLRDIETDQPRVFCFHKPKFSQNAHKLIDSTKSEKNTLISSMAGYLIEGASGNENSAFQFNVMLIKESVDRELWKLHIPDSNTARDEQIDVYPASNEERKRYEKQIAEKSYFIPPEVCAHLFQRNGEEVAT